MAEDDVSLKEEEAKIITVFGATGAQGGSIVRALCAEDSPFKVRAVTRHPNGERAQELKDLEFYEIDVAQWIDNRTVESYFSVPYSRKYFDKGCEVVEGDYDDYDSLRPCLEGSWGCFAVTDYFETMDKSSEVQQGKNIINMCCEMKVTHVVYSGLESTIRISGLVCDHFDGKADVEEFIKTAGLNHYTIIRLPWYYENLYENTPPTKVEENKFKLPIPIGNSLMYGISVDEIGPCVLTIFKEYEKYHSKTIGLAADQFRIYACCNILSKHLAPAEFVHAQISCDDYEAQDIPGVKELTNMFRYYKQARCERNIEQSRLLYPYLSTLDEWVAINKDKLRKAFEEVSQKPTGSNNSNHSKR